MTILQISDIHWTKRRKWNEDFKGMKDRFIKDVNEYKEKYGIFDYVFICGDIVFKGTAEEYKLAEEYIQKICDAAGCLTSDVFVVPGNHDVKRDAVGHETREMLNIALTDGERNNTFLDEVILKSKEMREAQFRAFEGYNDFAKSHLCGENVMDECLQSRNDINQDGSLYYHEQLAKKVGRFTVSVQGVNTALNCDGWDWNAEKGKGHKQMLPRRSYVLDEERKQEVRILMGHHPLPFLTEDKDMEEYLNSHYHIQLFGHVHEQYVDGDNYVRVQSGAFDPPKDNKAPERYKPVYNIIEIAEKDKTHVTVKGNAQIWNGSKFVAYDERSFEKVIEIEPDMNKWEQSTTPKMADVDKRGIKFKFIKLADRTKYYDKVTGVHFVADAGQSEYDNCLDFLMVVEKAGKLGELDNLIERI